MVLWQLPVMTTSRYTQSIKLLAGYLVVGNHKRTQQEVPTVLLLYIYFYRWFMLQQCSTAPPTLKAIYLPCVDCAVTVYPTLMFIC